MSLYPFPQLLSRSRIDDETIIGPIWPFEDVLVVFHGLMTEMSLVRFLQRPFLSEEQALQLVWSQQCHKSEDSFSLAVYKYHKED